VAEDLVVTRSLTIPAEELRWTAVRSGGPGGQNVNKVATKVELRFKLGTTRVIDPASRERIERTLRARLDADGNLFVVCQATRNQARNLELARTKLAELIRSALARPKARRATRKPAAANRKRLDSKRHRSEMKQTRRSVRDE
jgi:ribosome-associated protein